MIYKLEQMGSARGDTLGDIRILNCGVVVSPATRQLSVKVAQDDFAQDGEDTPKQPGNAAIPPAMFHTSTSMMLAQSCRAHTEQDWAIIFSCFRIFVDQVDMPVEAEINVRGKGDKDEESKDTID